MSNLVITYRKRKKRTVSLPASTPVLNPKACVFCLSEEDNEDEYGKLITKCGITVHYFCLLFSSGLSQGGKETSGVMGFLLSDIKKELKRGSRLRCSYCREKGSTIGCVVSACRKTFHLSCGRKLGTLHQFFDSFRSYCPEHRPQQTCKVSDRLAFYGTANTTCSICMNAVEARCSNETLRAPCCKNAWFHRACIQKYAMSAGLYFFKCPLCNNKELFQSEMLHYGIYVPDQDASWEQEPGAFEDLSRRYTHCDAETCRCPEGRSYDLDASKWEIVVCELCGSVGSHKACKGLKRRMADYVCSSCQEVEKRLKEEKRKKKSKSSSKRRKCASYYKSPKELDKLLKKRAETLSPCADGESSSSSSTSSDSTAHRHTNVRRTDVIKLVPCDEDVEVDILTVGGEAETVQKPRKNRRRYPKLCDSTVRKHRKNRCAARRSTTANTRATSGNNSTIADQQGNTRNCVNASAASNADVCGLGARSGECHPTRDSRLQLKNWSICASPLPIETITNDTDNCENDLCSIASVEEDGTHKTVTIKWRGRKIKIYKEIDRSQSTCGRTHGCGDGTAKMSLVMQVDECSSTKAVPTALPRSSSNRRLGFCAGDNEDEPPPCLVPVDVDISMRYTPQTHRLGRQKFVRSVPAKRSSSVSDFSDSEGPPILSPIVPYWDSARVEAGRMTRSMDKMQRYKTRLCASDYLSSLKSSASTSPRAQARRSLEQSFVHNNCRFTSPSAKKRKQNDADSESTLSCSSSVISVLSNGEEGIVDGDEDCQIYEPTPCIIASEKTAHRVSLSARIDIGNTLTHKSVDTRSLRTSLLRQEPEVIDLTDN